MGKAVFLDKLKERCFKIKDSVVYWVMGNKKLAVITISLVSVILICIILLISLSAKNRKPKEVYREKLELVHELVIPDGPELPRDYTISRQAKEKWSEQEAERWFSTPSETDLQGLSKANNNIVDKILRGTP